MAKMVILDRDGVINHDSREYIKSADEWVAIPGSIEAIYRLKEAGYRVTIATNQSGIARGLFTQKALRQIHEKLAKQLVDRGVEIDGIFYCPHGPEDNCDCRKPKPGLILQIVSEYAIEADETVFVGDSLRDIRAARQAGVQPVLVRTGNGEKTLQENEAQLTGVAVYNDLAHFVSETLGAR